MRTSLTILLTFIFSIGLHAQDCNPFWLTADSFLEAGGPENINWIIQNGDQSVFVEGDHIYNDTPWYEEQLCLPPGCYLLTVDSDIELSVNNMFVSVSGDFVIDSSEMIQNGGDILIEFCIAEIINEPCDLEIGVIGEACGPWFFEALLQPEDALVEWFVNGELYSSGSTMEFMPNGFGPYQVCAMYETPDCPFGVEACQIMELPQDCFGNPCELQAEVSQVDCGMWYVSIGGGVGDQYLYWELDGEPLYESVYNTMVPVGSNGLHELCVHYESDECGYQEVCVELVAEGCESQCTEIEAGMLSYIGEGGPAYVEWSLLDDSEQLLEEGIVQFSLNDYVYFFEDICLEEGCYYLEIYDPQGQMNQQSFSAWLGGFWGQLSVDIVANTNQYVTFYFCVQNTLFYPDGCPGEDQLWTGGECLDWAFEIGSFQEGEQAVWDFGDGTIVEGGHFIEHVYNEPGVYEVCVEFMSNDCEGTVVCTTIEVADCNNNCDVEVVFTEISCNEYIFDAVSVPADWYGWYVNGELVSDNELAFFFYTEEPGYYDICLFFESEECGGTEWCYDIEVGPDCFNDCPEDYIWSNGDCSNWIFELGWFQEGEVGVWDFGDGQIATGGHFIEHTYAEPGEYIVCVDYFSNECEGTYACTTIVVEECGDCFLEGEIWIEECYGAGVYLGGDLPWGVEPSIWVDGQYQLDGIEAFFELSAGWHLICASYYSELCEDEVEWCTEFFIPECDCPTVVDLEIDGCNVYASIPNATENAEIYWIVGNQVFSETAFLEWEAPENGSYFICAVYSDQFCEMTEICQFVTIEGCNEVEPCETDASYDNVGGGLYIFELDAPADAEVTWTVNGEEVGIGNPFTYEFADEGAFEVCGSYSTEECDLVFDCVNIIILPEVDCTPVVFFIDVPEGLNIDIELEYLIEGLGIDIEGVLNIYEECGSTMLELCIPDGCYNVTLSLEQFEEIALFIAIFIDNGLPIEYDINFLEQTVTIELPVNSDCTTGLDEVEIAEMQVYPNPASEVLTIIHPYQSGQRYEVLDITGKIVMQGVFVTEVADKLVISGLSAGSYIFRVNDAEGTSVQRFQVID